MNNRFFEIGITYYDIDSESMSGKYKKFTTSIGCEASSYTEAEAIATKWGDENIEVDFEISPIKEMDIIGVISHKENLGLWYIVKGIWSEYDDRHRLKSYKVNYLIQEKNPEIASKKILDLLKENYSIVRVSDVKETKISVFVYK